MKLKICGLKNREDVDAAVAAGVDALGFVLYKGSERYVDEERLLRLVSGLPPFVERWAVSVDMPLEEVERIDSLVHFDVWQLHGGETSAYCKALRPRRLVKAVGLPLPAESLFDAKLYDVDAFLLDSGNPGVGEVFDWGLADEFKRRTTKPIILSGGINSENLVRGVQMVLPGGIDVCSGVESEPGMKDHEKMKALVRMCKEL